MNDLPTDAPSGHDAEIGEPLTRAKAPSAIELPAPPARPVTVHVEIDDEDSVRTSYDLDLRRETADNIDRLAGVLLGAVVEAGSAYLGVTWDSPDVIHQLRGAIARRAAEL